MKMLKKLYSMFDTKTKIHSYPLGFHNDSEARREVGFMLANEPRFKSIKNDIVLVEVGTYDLSTGQITDTQVRAVDNGKTLIAEYLESEK